MIPKQDHAEGCPSEIKVNWANSLVIDLVGLCASSCAILRIFVSQTPKTQLQSNLNS